VQFARGILLRFSIWPTLKAAVAEQWGGPDSAEKRDFLVGHLVDEYGMPAAPPLPPVPTLPAAFSSAAGGGGAASSSTAPSAAPPAEIDVDDLTDIIEDYVQEEFECRIEDDSVYPVARDIVALHRAIFIVALTATDGGAEARAILDELEQAAARLKGMQVQSLRQSDAPEDDDDEDDEEGDSDDGEDDGDVDMEDGSAGPSGATPSSSARQEPQADEDGFTMVQSGRRRRH